jgi:hypothetical protein
MARTKKHHYLPKFYLRHFGTLSNPDQIWRIEKTKDANAHPVSIGDTGAESDYHTVERDGGAKDTFLLDSVRLEQGPRRTRHLARGACGGVQSKNNCDGRPCRLFASIR